MTEKDLYILTWKPGDIGMVLGGGIQESYERAVAAQKEITYPRSQPTIEHWIARPADSVAPPPEDLRAALAAWRDARNAPSDGEFHTCANALGRVAAKYLGPDAAALEDRERADGAERFPPIDPAIFDGPAASGPRYAVGVDPAGDDGPGASVALRAEADGTTTACAVGHLPAELVTEDTGGRWGPGPWRLHVENGRIVVLCFTDGQAEINFDDNRDGPGGNTRRALSPGHLVALRDHLQRVVLDHETGGTAVDAGEVSEDPEPFEIELEDGDTLNVLYPGDAGAELVVLDDQDEHRYGSALTAAECADVLDALQAAAARGGVESGTENNAEAKGYDRGYADGLAARVSAPEALYGWQDADLEALASLNLADALIGAPLSGEVPALDALFNCATNFQKWATLADWPGGKASAPEIPEGPGAES